MKASNTVLFILSFILFACAHDGAGVKKSVITGGELIDRVITVDTTLSGEITIKGSLIVKKSANLTVLPGTVIKFRRYLKDDDDISDSDIIVEGSITAVGTPEQPIIFTSAEQEKSVKDWKFLFINFARASRFKHCIVEYAFSGMQIHFTKAVVENCRFSNNFDGIRFSTAEIVIRDNVITNNVNGIRYEERGSPATITNNDIRNNKVGIFAVIRSDDLSKITGNNIYDNKDYNVKLGMEQDKDITMINNYWGTTDEAAIKSRIFDKAFDEQLGAVKVQPFLIEEISVAH